MTPEEDKAVSELVAIMAETLGKLGKAFIDKGVEPEQVGMAMAGAGIGFMGISEADELSIQSQCVSALEAKGYLKREEPS